ncbi:MAG: GGDEF domain-containing protein [Aquabacterium sp.]|nr:MAG: GGDEF domain-containing protein [Aquabacterium sp.]
MSASTPSWSDLLLGTEPRLRNRSLLTLLGSLVYVVWLLALVLFAMPQQRVSPELGWVFMVLMVPGILLFYPLVRSGRTQNFADPDLMSVQILWGCLIAVVAYATVPTGRAALLQTMGLALVFGFMSLSARTALQTGVILIAMLMAMLASSFVIPLPQFNPTAQTVKLLAASFIMGLITLQSLKFARLRERVLTERRELAAAQLALERVTRHDGLTGLLSRLYGQERLEREHQRAQLTGRTFGVVLMDLDHFKQINDRHGHQVGDEVLVAFAQAAREVLRDTDLIARWGGEEFLIILPDTHEASKVLQALERLQARLRTSVVSETVPALRVSFSAGYALWSAPEDVDVLLQRADRALYVAKNAGRDRCVQAD